jgi:hypothetical protein
MPRMGLLRSRMDSPNPFWIIACQDQNATDSDESDVIQR